METTYRLVVIGERGMYTSGDDAATPELARIAVGNLYRGRAHRLGVERIEWIVTPSICTATRGELRPEIARRTLVEAESAPGEWTIGTTAEQEVA